jgi:hypothetical protein
MGLGIFIGGPIGYAIDTFRDLAGLKEMERNSYPDFIRRQGPKAKIGIASLLTAATIAITTGIYYLTPNKMEKENIQHSTLEKVIESKTDKIR